MAFVAVVSLAALFVAIVAWRPTNDYLSLAIGTVAVVLIGAYAIRSISGVDVIWSSAVSLHLSLVLCLGTAGALAGAVGQGIVSGLLIEDGPLRSAFNVSEIFLMSIASRAAALAVVGNLDTASRALLGGLVAGVTSWIANVLLVSTVIWVASNGRVSVRRGIADNLGVLPYHVGYGWFAIGVAVLYRDFGVVSFALALPAIAIAQDHLVRLGRRTEEHRRILARAEEQERRRIAIDIHDGPIQSAAGLAMTLAAASYRLAAHFGQEAQEWADLMTKSAGEMRKVARDLRTLIIEIAPPTLHDDGLGPAVRQLAVRMDSPAVDVRIDDSIGLTEEQATLAYRVIQEAIRNVEKHAQATAVTVSLTADAGSIWVTIADDGRGFSEDDVTRRRTAGHVGTRGIEELARGAGAKLTIESTLGQGTNVMLQMVR